MMHFLAGIFPSLVRYKTCSVQKYRKNWKTTHFWNHIKCLKDVQMNYMLYNLSKSLSKHEHEIQLTDIPKLEIHPYNIDMYSPIFKIIAWFTMGFLPF